MLPATRQHMQHGTCLFSPHYCRCTWLQVLASLCYCFQKLEAAKENMQHNPVYRCQEQHTLLCKTIVNARKQLFAVCSHIHMYKTQIAQKRSVCASLPYLSVSEPRESDRNACVLGMQHAGTPCYKSIPALIMILHRDRSPGNHLHLEQTGFDAAVISATQAAHRCGP